MVNLDHTLLSGQTFAFVKAGGGYAGVVDGKPCYVEEARDGLTIRCEPGDDAFWHSYFDMERDYDTVFSHLERGDPAALCARAFPGLRLLKQPIWETVCAFIISANNHQRRIESIYSAVARALGEEKCFKGHQLFSFPSAERLADAPEEMLRMCGAGYRARYLTGTARRIAEGFSLDLDSMDYEEALAHLTLLPGIGEKVADCVLLFSTRHGIAFPIDVWMERVLREAYGMQGNKKQIKRQAQERFGGDAGLIQQVLFHGARVGVLSLAGKNRKAI